MARMVVPNATLAWSSAIALVPNATLAWSVL